jgi:energy-coupling factor transporter ATP-binding protein EcfA2
MNTEHSIIKSIYVENLFGTYTYDIENAISSSDASRLFVLYGDNGSGKTTILQMLFHLLSPDDGGGHRTYLAQVRFNAFRVLLWDGTSVSVTRDNNRTEGPYIMSVARIGCPTSSVEITPNDEGKVKNLDDSPGSDYSTVLNILSEIGLALYYLSDERRMLISPIDDQSISLHFRMVAEQERRRLIEREMRQLAEGEGRQHPDLSSLKEAIYRAEMWIRNQAFEGSSKGEENVNSIYSQISRVFISTNRSRVNITEAQVETLCKTLVSLTARSQELAKFGFTSVFESQDFISALSKATTESRSLLYSIINPYVEGIEAKFDALQEISDIVRRLTKRLSTLLSDKYVAYDVRGGFSIYSARNDELLQPLMLSRGERQLILLLCNTIVARDRKSLFIIDEPEISLNIKWQRQLIEILLECTMGADVQFILATHSIEILSRYQSSVSRLVDSNRTSSIQEDC